MPNPMTQALLWPPRGRQRDNRMIRGPVQQAPTSSNIGNARNLAGAGLGLSLLTGIPGLSTVGAGIGTGQDVRNFARPSGAPTFQGSGPQHFMNAASGGLFGQNLRDQAVRGAAQINPNMNPADVYSGTVERPQRTGVSRGPGGRSFGGGYHGR